MNKPRVIYHILVDRFSTGDKKLDLKLSYKLYPSKEISEDYSKVFMGGNIRGIIQNFSYLQELGIDCIYLSPIYRTSAYHGYHITDFFEIDPRFGNKTQLKELVHLAHRSNIKIILDFVPNHCSELHPFFIEAKKRKNSRYKNWFIFTKWPEKYLCFLNFPELPKLNLEDKECRSYILKAARYWIEEFDIDGYRVDHAIGPPFDFWKKFIKTLKAIKKDILVLPEIWINFNTFHQLKTLWFLKENRNWKIERIIGFFINRREDYTYKLFAHYFKTLPDFIFQKLFVKFYESPSKLEVKALNHFLKFRNLDFFLFADNHDLPRLMYICNNKENKFKKTLKLLFSFNKPLILYYGTEIGMSCNNPGHFRTHQDREYRRFMNWNFKNKERKLLDFTKDLIKEHKAQLNQSLSNKV